MITRQTTKELIAASFKDLCKNKSAEKITVKEICRNCGITSTTFYNHFSDKYDLTAWIYSTQAEKIMSKIDDTIYKWKDSLTDGIRYFLDNKDFLKNLIMHTSGQNSFINHVAQFNIKILSDYIKRSQKIKILPHEVEIAVKIYCYGTVCLLCEIIMDKNIISAEDLIKLVEKSLPAPLKKYLYKS